MNLKIEGFLAMITMGVTLVTGDIMIDFAVGISVYFSSRLLYKHYGKTVDAFFIRLKKRLFKK
ncbi:hypothetical protein OD91_0843 [Lutibacter sp. Hel_I_33_5]|uniref:hypothetical protein n=1 Tax=Lutibacter sp. Hel_I_33_5 TaxID=1566289 RepID=UPI0011A7C284|nr:hypothetical protein [Lutibacter sp. Hel_I_33_5]TVZ55588.1 hypothetical protein OD91_0843 [Lutibacter sp. Hel_I_33_5]